MSCSLVGGLPEDGLAPLVPPAGCPGGCGQPLPRYQRGQFSPHISTTAGRHWRLTGCMRPFFLPETLNQTESNSLAGCTERCKQNGFSVAGVYNASCRCGNYPPPNYAVVDRSECSLSCLGNPNQKCGGRESNIKMSVNNVNDLKVLCHTC